ncbi:hypothetical protein CPAR01_15130 [Colletotrichum paranaense]|uniref:Secreted protein n=2 Tax=Colletotrichum acutatum species complex TaxID=2707335 RepID=A0AAI9UCP1_9PEZI|nr:uncharacterized protein CPAR01_15130 [Colletotrichum paranaense]XP_060406012.1 uncharacterized protein CABS01_00115 [Colletotrichum abscissum]KAK1454576.1 hypothetical protein CMEL01_16641 [Colletotrichum melonis]KAK1520079.1 hypothetical protein CPAR01_15130 [Colletotrichum paranaense]KAK1525026.1 hypothetical protein CABS01_00115 [Colletotrichum abscissum]
MKACTCLLVLFRQTVSLQYFHSMPHVGILPYYVGLYKVNCNGPRGMNRQVKHGVRHAIACGIHPFQYKRTLDTDTLIPLIPLIP